MGLISGIRLTDGQARSSSADRRLALLELAGPKRPTERRLLPARSAAATRCSGQPEFAGARGAVDDSKAVWSGAGERLWGDHHVVVPSAKARFQHQYGGSQLHQVRGSDDGLPSRHHPSV